MDFPSLYRLECDRRTNKHWRQHMLT